MSSTTATPSVFTAAVPVAAAGPRRGAWTATLRRMIAAIRTRRQLAAMDGRMLSDIGISRAEAEREAARAVGCRTSRVALAKHARNRAVAREIRVRPP